MRRAAAVVVVLALVACPGKRAEPVVDPLGDLLRQADAAWEVRAEHGFFPVKQLLERARLLDSQSPEVLWRLARVHAHEGLVAVDRRAALTAYGHARATGLECLGTDPTFAQRRVEVGWEGALDAVTDRRASCLVWTTFAWVRWVHLQGSDAASLDLGVIDLLVERATELASAGPHRHLVLWSAGVLAATRPAVEGRDLEQAGGLLAEAMDIAPYDLSTRADFVELVAVPAGDLAEARAQAAVIRAENAHTLEDRRAVERRATWEL